PDVCNTTTLLLSEDGDVLFVGARDAVLSLDVSQKEAIVIRSKFLNTTHMYACGTYAFSPRCTY
ncbi:hypothetical protein CRUP_034124, partial [Coryphaenoides rupestris]